MAVWNLLKIIVYQENQKTALTLACRLMVTADKGNLKQFLIQSPQNARNLFIRTAFKNEV